MIKVRVSVDLRPGSNASAEGNNGHTVVYLLPGLTPAQRRAALRRLRQQGRMGLGPRLPPAQLAVALALFRMRRACWQALAIVRLHPAGSAVPMLVLSGVVAAFLLTSVSVHIVRLPAATGNVGGGAIAESAPTPSPAGELGTPPGDPGATGGAPGQQATRPGSATAPAPTVGDPGGGTGGSPLTSVAASSPPAGRATPSAVITSAPPSTPPPAPSPTPSPVGRGASSGNCITLGLIQLCISL